MSNSQVETSRRINTVVPWAILLLMVGAAATVGYLLYTPSSRDWSFTMSVVAFAGWKFLTQSEHSSLDHDPLRLAVILAVTAGAAAVWGSAGLTAAILAAIIFGVIRLVLLEEFPSVDRSSSTFGSDSWSPFKT